MSNSTVSPILNCSAPNCSYYEENFFTEKKEEPLINAIMLLLLGVIQIIESVVALYILSKCKRLVSELRIIIINITVSDILLGLATTFCAVYNAILRIYEQEIPYSQEVAISKSVAIMSYCFTGLLASERLISICCPNFYLRTVTSEKIRMICIIMWLFDTFIVVAIVLGLVYGISGEYFNDIANAICQIVYFIIVVMVIISSYLMHRYGMQHLKRITYIDKAMSKRFMSKNYKPTKVALLLCGILIVSTFPWFLYSTIKLCDESVYNHLQPIFKTPVRIMVYINHLVHPYVYVFRFSECKRKLYAMLHCSTKNTETVWTTNMNRLDKKKDN